MSAVIPAKANFKATGVNIPIKTSAAILPVPKSEPDCKFESLIGCTKNKVTARKIPPTIVV